MDRFLAQKLRRNLIKIIGTIFLMDYYRLLFIYMSFFFCSGRILFGVQVCIFGVLRNEAPYPYLLANPRYGPSLSFHYWLFLFICSLFVQLFTFCSVVHFLFSCWLFVQLFTFCSVVHFLFICSLFVHLFIFCSFVHFLFICSLFVHLFTFLFICSLFVQLFISTRKNGRAW